MKRFLPIYTCIFLLLLAPLSALDKIDDLSFTNTEITEVIKVISEAFGVTIIPDKDVYGNVTRYFKDTSLEETLVLLLEPLGYTYEVKEGIYFVHKKPLFAVEYTTDKKLVTLTSENGVLQEIIAELSKKTKETIIFTGNAGDRVSIRIYEKPLEETLKLLTKSLPYDYKKEGNAYLILKKEDDNFFDSGTNISKRIKLTGDAAHISVSAYNQSTKDIILALFTKYKKELTLLSANAQVIPYLDISDIDFESLLTILLDYAGLGLTREGERYYIYASLNNKQSNRYLATGMYKFKYLDYKRFTTLVPPHIISPSMYKIDADTNLILFYGSPSEVEEAIHIVREVDTNQKGYVQRLFTLSAIDVKNVKKYLPAKYANMPLTLIEEKNMFSMTLDDADYAELTDWLSRIDIEPDRFVYKCKFLEPEEITKNLLPSTVKKEQYVVNPHDSSIIFTIPEKSWPVLADYLAQVDVPVPVIRYQLLIVEYIKKNELKVDWGFGFKTGKGKGFAVDVGVFNESDSISAAIDFPSIFGHYFSAQFEQKLYEEKAKIQMSTEIYGISGETVTISNTQTYQYRDDIKDLDTNTTTPVYSSTTFGLNLEIKGRATSSDEVFLEVSARISDELPGSEEGTAPNTTEKSVKNSIRTKTGKPIVLGGLTNKKESLKHKKIPGLAHIPFIGNAFKTHDNDYQDSEFVIYIIPFIQKTEDELQKERREMIGRIYKSLLKGKVYGE